MARVIAAMNMTLDGYCDHTAMIADDEIHQHYTDLLKSSGTAVYGRITYQLTNLWNIGDPSWRIQPVSKQWMNLRLRWTIFPRSFFPAR